MQQGWDKQLNKLFLPGIGVIWKKGPVAPERDSLSRWRRSHLPLSLLLWDYRDPRELLVSKMNQGVMGLLQRGKDKRPVGWDEGYRTWESQSEHTAHPGRFWLGTGEAGMDQNIGTFCL